MTTPETFFVPTPDGWSLAVHCLQQTAGTKRYPLVMLHGFGANRLCFNFNERYSFAKAAHQRGFQVYIVELRGAGLSKPTHEHVEKAWGFDDFNYCDLPFALDAILSHSKSPQVHALGHSMGGMLFYAFGCRFSRLLRSISTIGSPLLSQLQLARREQRLLQWLLRMVPKHSKRQLPLKRLLGVASRYVVPLVSDGILVNSNNIELNILEKMAHAVMTDVPTKLILELTHTLCAQKLLDTFAHEKQLSDISVPTLVVSGSQDRIAPPTSVKAAIESLGSKDVRYREFGMQYGDKANYGHVDLLMGKHAPTEIYPFVLDFVEEVD